MRLDAHFRLAFATAPLVSEINLAAWNNSPDHYAKGTAVRHCCTLRCCHSPPTACKPIGFRFYFTPLTGVLFNFPSRYLCAIGLCLVFSLRPWSAWIPTGFHVSRSTWDTSRRFGNFAYEAFTLYCVPFHALPLLPHLPH